MNSPLYTLSTVAFQRIGTPFEIPAGPYTKLSLLGQLAKAKATVVSPERFTDAGITGFDPIVASKVSAQFVKVSAKGARFNQDFVDLAASEGLRLLPQAAGPLVRLNAPLYEWPSIFVATKPFGRIPDRLERSFRGQYIWKLGQSSRLSISTISTVDADLLINSIQYWLFNVS